MKKDKAAWLNAFERHFSLYYLIYIFAFLLIAAIVLIGQAAKSDGFQKELCLSLGTGLITSFFVSLAFVFSEKTKRKIESIKQRESFLFDFKMLFHSMLTYLDFDKSISSPSDYIGFLKIQHRWFHEYYKRMVAKNTSLKETNVRVKQISDFFKAQSGWIKQYFEFDSRWKNCYLNDNERNLLNRFYISFKKAEISLEQKTTKQLFYDFAFFIEWLSRFPETFLELRNFKIITVSSKEANIVFDFEKFYEKEKHLAFINDFHETRRNIYKSSYSKQDKKAK